MDIVSNPWFVGIVGGCVSSLLVAFFLFLIGVSVDVLPSIVPKNCVVIVVALIAAGTFFVFIMSGLLLMMAMSYEIFLSSPFHRVLIGFLWCLAIPTVLFGAIAVAYYQFKEVLDNHLE